MRYQRIRRLDHNIGIYRTHNSNNIQWRSHSLKSGWAQGVWGTEVRGVQGRSSDGDLWAKPPEARYIQTVCSTQTFFSAGLLPSPSSISPTPPPPKKTLRICTPFYVLLYVTNCRPTGQFSDNPYRIHQIL